MDCYFRDRALAAAASCSFRSARAAGSLTGCKSMVDGRVVSTRTGASGYGIVKARRSRDHPGIMLQPATAIDEVRVACALRASHSALRANTRADDGVWIGLGERPSVVDIHHPHGHADEQSVGKELRAELATRNRNANAKRTTGPQRKGDGIADQLGHSHSPFPFLFLVPSCSCQSAAPSEIPALLLDADPSIGDMHP